MMIDIYLRTPFIIIIVWGITVLFGYYVNYKIFIDT